MTKYLNIALAVCLAALAISIKSCTKIKTDRNRLSDNQRSLFDEATFYRTKDSLSAASVERLTLSKSELEEYCGELVKTCETLNIKVRRLQSASTSATQTKYHIQTVLRDSLVVRDSLVIDTIQCMTYQDAWLTFTGCTADGSHFDVDVASLDTLTTIAHRVPRRFWFIRYGCKAIRQEVIAKNPHSRITYTEYIEVER